MKPATTVAALLTRFFSQRLMQQRQASPHTIHSYRDTFRLLLQFAKSRLGKEPSQLAWEALDAPLISAFLDDLQAQRRIGARSRNLRLTAIRSFFGYAAFELPEHAEQIQRVLAIPAQRCVHEQVHYLSRPEVDGLLAAPDQSTWSGRRDHAWLLLAVQTGLRSSELTALTREETHLGAGAHATGAHFGHLEIGRARRALMAFVMVLAWSRMIYLRFFLDARMENFLRGHVGAFGAWGGLARVLLYDNLKSAVLERQGQAIRFNPTLLQFAGHYRYEPRPVAIARGNEKGRVEKAIRYVREAFFAGRTFLGSGGPQCAGRGLVYGRGG
jgi:integrase